jgi:hypothetical protein
MPEPSVSPTPQVRPTTVQVLLTFFGGLVLAGGSCAGFLGTLNLNRGDDPVNIAFAIGFVLSLLLAGIGVLLAIIRVIRLARQRRTGTAPGISDIR